uniref:Multifunctional fusion protein n=1 Tax=Branchiostoma floridae TaxID=7739 RepID=C3XXH8_BRAFL|eukprot:XP_002611428.1 hypothetical protein BRAFLDRAFT_63940 [Branchiostoma floridae]
MCDSDCCGSCWLIFRTLAGFALYIADFVTDVILAAEYYRNGHYYWFGLTLGFALGPQIIVNIVLAFQDDDCDCCPYGCKWSRWVYMLPLGVPIKYLQVLCSFVCGDLSPEVVRARRTERQATQHPEARLVNHLLPLARLVSTLLESLPELCLQIYILLQKGQQSSFEIHPLKAVTMATVTMATAKSFEIHPLKAVTMAVSFLASLYSIIEWEAHFPKVVAWVGGILILFLWKIIDLSTRMFALCLFASVYRYWVFVAVGIHWLVMAVVENAFYWCCRDAYAWRNAKADVIYDTYCWVQFMFNTFVVAPVDVFTWVTFGSRQRTEVQPIVNSALMFGRTRRRQFGSTVFDSFTRGVTASLHVHPVTAMEGDENVERGNWSHKMDYLLSLLGFAVGLGNVWRFPYLCYRNGGGAFLIPYVIMLLLSGLPLFLMELALGQFASQGPISVWKLSPIFKGVGFAMFTISSLIGIYYIVLLAYSLFYLFASFTSELPWNTGCTNAWNTPDCTISDHGLIWINGTWYNRTEIQDTELWNASKRVWRDGAIQIFFSLGTSWGQLITLSSYSRFHNNCYRDALVIAVLNCLTSFYAGFAIFSVLGFMANEMGVKVEDVADTGAGLAFVAYPAALARLPISPLWSSLFFVMLLTLGLDSQFAVLEALVTGIVDEFPRRLRSKKMFIVLGMCAVGFLLGLPLVTQGGFYLLQLMDNYSGTFSLLVVAIVECVVVGWVYGCDRFLDDISMMIGSRPCLWWKICWKVLTPLSLLFILIFQFTVYSPTAYGDYTYPFWAEVLGWCMVGVAVLMLPAVALYKVCCAKGTLYERVSFLVEPSWDWGPALDRHRDGEVYQFLHGRDKATGEHREMSDFIRTASGGDESTKI